MSNSDVPGHMVPNCDIPIDMSNNDNCVSEVTSAISRIILNPTRESRGSNSVPYTENARITVIQNETRTPTGRSSSVSCLEGEIKSCSPQSPDSPAVELPKDLLTDTIRLRLTKSAVTLASNTSTAAHLNYKIPIVGYEIIEERARFTVYKLRIENIASGDCWFVFRRYTDFVRLYSKLKDNHPAIHLTLPRKRWFGDNFDPHFLEERIQGLQSFVNTILQHEKLYNLSSIRDFFCLDEPPSYSESMEESRAIFEALEETIYHLRCQLREKELQLNVLRSTVSSETKKKDSLIQFIKTGTKDCPHCSRELLKLEAPRSSSTPVKAEAGHIPEHSEDEGSVKPLVGDG